MIRVDLTTVTFRLLSPKHISLNINYRSKFPKIRALQALRIMFLKCGKEVNSKRSTVIYSVNKGARNLITSINYDVYLDGGWLRPRKIYVSVIFAILIIVFRITYSRIEVTKNELTNVKTLFHASYIWRSLEHSKTKLLKLFKFVSHYFMAAAQTFA